MKKYYLTIAAPLLLWVLLLTTQLSWAQTGSQTFDYTSTGNEFSFTVPAGVTSITVVVWGGGGAGGGVATATGRRAGGGGAGGSCARGTLTVVSGTEYTVTVGTGGYGVSGDNGGNGNNSSFGSSIIAVGGPGGYVGNDTDNWGNSRTAPNSGNTVTGSSTASWYGGDGAAANGTNNNQDAGGGGGSAGTGSDGGNSNSSTGGTAGTGTPGGAVGGNGLSTGSGPGANGNLPGAAGGGARLAKDGGTNYAGGNGAHGRVYITWTCPASAGTLSGTQTVCMGSTTTFSSTVLGGTWSSGNTSIATIDPTTGVITPVATGGPVTMTYTVDAGGGCTPVTATRTVTVNENTWTGSINSNWDNSDNWCGGVPTSSINAIIPDATTTSNDPVVNITTAACNNLTIQSGGVISIGAGAALTVSGSITNSAGASGLVIKSTSEGGTGTGSLITSSAVAATVERYMSEDVWHIVSAPVSNQGISGFLTNTGNPITSYGAPYNDYDMIYYIESSDDWSDFYPTNWSETTMGVAKGYSVVPQNNAAVVFSGTLNAESPAISITRSRQGWNCIGNPYPTAISVNSFFTDNSNANGNLIDPNFKALYLWDEGAGYTGTTFEYIALSNVAVNLPWVGDRISQTQVALGQGFIIRKASSGSASITFTPAMKVIPSDAVFKDATIPWPAMQLFVTGKTAELKSSTIVAINDQMSKGLDPGYDVGMLKANSDFALFTRLVEGDKGVDFTIQSLSASTDYEQNPFRIPVGLDYTEGGEVTFTARISGFPSDIPVYLEDKLLQKTININTPEASYTTTVGAGNKGIGRFYLHGSSKLVTSVNQISVNEYLVYTIGNAIVVNGNFNTDTRLILHSVDGRTLYEGKAGKLNEYRIDASRFPSGVYLLSILDKGQRQTKKIVLGHN